MGTFKAPTVMFTLAVVGVALSQRTVSSLLSLFDPVAHMNSYAFLSRRLTIFRSKNVSTQKIQPRQKQ